MVPDIEREWIAEETRTAPQPPRRLLGLILLTLAIGWALYRWLA